MSKCQKDLDRIARASQFDRERFRFPGTAYRIVDRVMEEEPRLQVIRHHLSVGSSAWLFRTSQVWMNHFATRDR
jgi:hypothetical protein